MNHQFFQDFIIPKNLLHDLDRQRTQINLIRVLPIAIIFYVIEWVIFYLSAYFYDVGHIVLGLQIASSLILPVLIYAKFKFQQLSHHFVDTILGIYTVILITYSIIVALNTQAHADLLHMHIMIMTGIIAILYLKIWESFILIMGSCLIMIILFPYFQNNPEIVLINQINLFIYDIVLWFFALGLFKTRLKTMLLEHDLILKNQELEHLVKTDSMTKLYNHQAILDFLIEEMQRSERNEQALSIILLDIDDFKRINDQFGHQVGDEVLISLSKIIKHSLRSIDRVGRYGGEEFLILLPNTNLNAGRHYALRLQSLIRNYKLPNEENLTLSGGLAEYTGESIDELIKQADKLLYQAKKSGKNQIISQ